MFLSFFYNLAVFLTTIIFLICVSIFIYYKHAFSYWKKRNVFHYPPSFPFGNTGPKVTKYVGQIIAKFYKKFKEEGVKFAGIYIFTSPVFVSIDPEISKLLLTKAFTNFQDHGIYVDENNDKMSVNLLTLTDKKWKNMREILNPAFSSGKIKMMFPILMECSKGIEAVLQDAVVNNKPIDVHDIAGRFTTDVIGSCIFGIECNCLKNPNSKFRSYGKKFFEQSLPNILRLRIALQAPFISKIFGINFFDPKVTSFFRNVVLETIKIREESNLNRPDLLNILLKLKNNKNAGFEVTSDFIAAQSFLFYVAGFETTSTTAAYCLYELAQNFEMQQKIKKELQQTLKENNGELNYEGLINMTYLDKVMSETLRKYPTVLMVDRNCTKDFQIPDTNVTIEKGTKVFISILGIHNDPEFYPNPEEFNPERFSKEEKLKRQTFSYLPFGEGPRICPGGRLGLLKAKIFVISLLKKYNFTLHQSTQVPLKTYSIGNVSNPISQILIIPKNDNKIIS